MSYNRWMPVQCSSELYHHGVKGMKWGKRLFGKGLDLQPGAGGGGGGSNEEDLELLEKLKELYGEKAYEKFLEAKQKRADAVAFNKETQQMVKDTRDEDALHRANVKFLSKRHKEYNEAKEAYEKTPKAKVEKAKNAITHPGETASKVVQSGKDLANKAKEKSGLTTREELKYQEAHRRAFDELHYKTRDESTPFGKMAQNERKESNAKINKLRDEYSKTPLGKAEGSVQKGMRAVKSALRKHSQKKNEDRRQFSAHSRETRKIQREKEEREYRETRRQESAREHYANTHKTIESSDTHGLRTRKRRVTGKGTGVHVHGPGLNGERKR